MTPSLRAQVLRGGAYLTLRQAIGTAINVAGVLLLTRTIGPHAWGVYHAVMGLLVALQLIAQMGVGVYLVRREVEGGPESYWVASTLMLVFGTSGAALGILAIPLVSAWTRIDLIGPVAFVMFATLPLSNLAQVPLARLERELDYRRIAWIELTGQCLFFLVSVPLAFADAGPWAPVAGFVSQQLSLLVLLHGTTRYVPRPHWDVSVARDALSYGVGFTGSLWLYQLRRTVNPLVVGRYLGAEAVGIVALTTQIVTHLSFVALATWRLSMAALARVQSDLDRLRRAVSDGMLLQTLAVAPFLLLFAWVAPLLVPWLFGREWTDIARLYPFLAVAALVNAVFNLESSALYVLRRNQDMSLFHVLQTGLLAVVSVLLVPRLGLLGYGVAEIAALGSYVLLHVFTARAIGSPAYVHTLSVALAVAPALGYAYLGPWSLAGLPIVAAALRPWRALPGMLAQLRGAAYE